MPDERPVGALHHEVGGIRRRRGGLGVQRRDLVRLLGARRGADAAQREEESRAHALPDSGPLGGHSGVWCQSDLLFG